MNIIKILSVLIFLSFTINGQNTKTDSTKSDTTQSTNFDWFAYPYAMYSPETNFAFGGAGIIYFRTSNKKETLPSQITFSAYYTVNNQFSTFWDPIIYFNNNKNEVGGELYFAHKIDKFYGTGSNSEEIPNPQYNFKIAEISLYFKRTLYDNLKAIALFEYNHYVILEELENPFMADSSIAGINGGNNLGVGLGFNLDSRDNIFFPSGGAYVDFYSLFFLKALGTDFIYNEYVLDARYYKSIFSDNRVLAFQFYSAITTGNTPFYSMPRLGGAWMMRGYYEGRFRDKTFTTFQAEFRDELFWKLGFTLFASAGDVGSSLNTYKLTHLKYSYGFGLRFMFDKKERINIRFDVAFGNNTSGIYFAIKEAF
jgi:hypothetical protein